MDCVLCRWVEWVKVFFSHQGGIRWTVGQTDIKAKYFAIRNAAGWIVDKGK